MYSNKILMKVVWVRLRMYLDPYSEYRKIVELPLKGIS